MINKDDKSLDRIIEALNGEEMSGLEKKMANSESLKSSFADVCDEINLYAQLDELAVPEVSSKMDQRFYDMLEEEVGKSSFSFLQAIKRYMTFQNLKPVLYGAAMLAIGMFFGINLKNDVSHEIPANNWAAQNSESVKDLAVLSMLKLPSVSQRLQAVSLVNSPVDHSSDKVLTALFFTLNNDTNINVRLAVLNTLAQYSHDSRVRVGLVDAIIHQDSAIIQVAISELMLNLDEKKAVKPLQQLLDDKSDMNDTAREKITHTLDQLI